MAPFLFLSWDAELLTPSEAQGQMDLAYPLPVKCSSLEQPTQA